MAFEYAFRGANLLDAIVAYSPDVVEHELAHFLRVLPDGMQSKYISCMLAIVVTCTQCNFRCGHRRVIDAARILPLRTSPPAPAHAVRASGNFHESHQLPNF